MEKELFYVKIVGIIFDTTTRKILVGRLNGDDHYSFIEGDLTHDEELDKCLKRTVKETTGFKIHNLGAIYAENILKKSDKLKLHFLCEIAEGELIPGGKITELIWVKPSEVEEKLGVELPSRLHEYITNLE
jgi:ADP-ribose pyrophosphatase YjhB (NUDIX family)